MQCFPGGTMIQGIYNSAAAADGLQTWNDVIARNIAAASTPGFKRDTISFDGIVSGYMAAGASEGRAEASAVLAPVGRGAISLASGEMKRSGDPLEFAIEGSGFFRLQRPDGEMVYTRDGQFRVSPEGQLISKQGYAVAGDGGPIQLLIDGGPLSIDPEGRVSQGDQEIGVLTVFDFENPSSLQRTVGGFAVDPAHPQAARVAEDSRVRQGFLEMSNVSAIREMVDMITVSNALQANQRVIQTFDGISERAVQVLGASGS